MTTKRVLIADDHVIFREGLKQFISSLGNMVVADAAASGTDALAKVRENDYDLVILDISLPGKSGLDVLADIKRAKPNLPVLILSMYPEEQFGLRALKAGAAGYLTKGMSAHELSIALQRVVSGRRYISPTLAESVVDSLQAEYERPVHEALSVREYQITCMIAAGKKPKQIAAELAMSVKTVSSYRSRIFAKMNVSNNAELIRYAAANNLI